MAIAAALAAVNANSKIKQEQARIEQVARHRKERPSGTGLLDNDASISTRPARFQSKKQSRIRPAISEEEPRRNSLSAMIQRELEQSISSSRRELRFRRWSFRWMQSLSRSVYSRENVQYFFAFLIAFNFLVTISDAQLAATKTDSDLRIFNAFEWFFAAIFTVELVWNMFSHWLVPFWVSGWNIFDFVIILICWLALTLSNLPGIAVLRLLRAFRVFRLFRRIPTLKGIVEAILASLPAVGNAFVILGILMGIWSILGVEFFGAYDDGEFGNFAKAMFTMWQILFLDNAGSVFRTLIFAPGANLGFWGSAFYLTYVFCACIVILNVVIAVLLDNYLRSVAKQKEDAAEARKAAEREAGAALPRPADGQPQQPKGTDSPSPSRPSRNSMLRMTTSGAAEEGANPRALLESEAASELLPKLGHGVLHEVCSISALLRLPRDELIDLASVLFTASASREHLLRHAHAKALEGKVAVGTVGGDLLHAFALVRALEAAESARAEEAARSGVADGGAGGPDSGRAAMSVMSADAPDPEVVGAPAAAALAAPPVAAAAAGAAAVETAAPTAESAAPRANPIAAAAGQSRETLAETQHRSLGVGMGGPWPGLWDQGPGNAPATSETDLLAALASASRASAPVGAGSRATEYAQAAESASAGSDPATEARRTGRAEPSSQ